jgi:hypothetical protein
MNEQKRLQEYYKILKRSYLDTKSEHYAKYIIDVMKSERIGLEELKTIIYVMLEECYDFSVDKVIDYLRKSFKIEGE